jgi:hypothetical protein
MNWSRIEPGRAPERHLDPDLARPLFDDDVHDVRHADPADDERQRADDPEERAEPEHEGVQELEHLRGVPDTDRFFVLGIEPMLRGGDLEDLRLQSLGLSRIPSP